MDFSQERRGIYEAVTDKQPEDKARASVIDAFRYRRAMRLYRFFKAVSE